MFSELDGEALIPGNYMQYGAWGGATLLAPPDGGGSKCCSAGGRLKVVTPQRSKGVAHEATKSCFF